MATVLSPIERRTWGAPSPEEIEHANIARKHFLKYCDTGKCINPPAHKRNWHEWPCTECAFNPYNMKNKDGDLP